MAKKLILLAMAVGALLAFALPAVASAQQITNSEGEPAANVTAVSTNTVTNVPGGLQLGCTTVNLAVNLTSNTPETSAGILTGTAEGNPYVSPQTHTGACSTNTGTPVQITSINGSIHLASGANTASFNYAYDIAGVIPCTFEGAGTVTYVPGSDEISVVAPGTGAGEGCPPVGTVEGSFTVLDENGNPAEIM
jgi:hypothetical protein